ncbi:MAG: ImmA/IrrE family metallo-endopeptidase [Ruminococcus sp.]|nr:ImmA/IrrE family metallo-endopeptidase [Ruminococcus sp.]
MECGINLIYDDMGTEDTSIKAMMIVYRRIKNIVVNENLPDIIMTFILAHELGHAVLHASRCKQFTDYGLFDNSGVMEKEANIFAAELLLGDSDDLYHEMRYSELTLFQIAAAHNVPYELLAYKLEIMEEEGYDVPELPYEPDSSFLSGYLGDYDSDWL